MYRSAVNCGKSLSCFGSSCFGWSKPFASLLVFLCALLHVTTAVGQFDQYDLRNLELLSHTTIEDSGGMGGGNDIWGWTDRSLAPPLTPREYALVAREGGTAFVDITDPYHPTFKGTLPTATGSSTWRDIKVYNDHAYIVSDANGPHGVQIFDLTRLRNVSSPQTFSPDARYSGTRSAHNISINEETGYAYVTDGRILDLSNPTNPSRVGTAASGTHDTHAVVYQGSDTDYQGREILFSFTGSNVQVLDVQNKSSVSLLSSIQLGTYEHQGWLSEDHNYLFVNAEQDLTWTYVLDVSDLDNPVAVGSVSNQRWALDHNLYVKGDRIYSANYAAGLRVFDIVDPSTADLREVAHIDTFPSRDRPTYQGAWSVYPYFDSGSIIVNDRTNGLFVVRLDLSHGDFDDDGSTGSTDIDLLTTAVSNGSNDVSFDMNADGVVDYDDVLQWLEVAGANEFGSGNFFLLGDANLDGAVDVSDFNIWNANKLTGGTFWTRGDFNADGVTDVADFNLWNSNKFLNSETVAVPEPVGAALLLFGLCCIAAYTRKK